MKTSQNHHKELSFFSLVCATLLYGLYGVVSKVVGTDFGVFFLGWTRSAVIALLIVLYLLFSKRWTPVRKEDYPWFLAMSIFGIASFLTIFVAFNHLAIGTALFAYYASATVTSYCIGYLLFQETLTARKVALLGMALLGLFFLFYDRSDGGQFSFLFLACFSGIAGAVWNVFSKKVSTRYPIAQITFLDALIAIAISVPLSLMTQEAFSLGAFTEKFPFVLLFALIILGAIFFTLLGFKYLSAHSASVVMLLEAVFGVLFGWLFFQEFLSSFEIVGGVLIILSVGFISQETQSMRLERLDN